MFEWRNKKKYLRIILKIPSDLDLWYCIVWLSLYHISAVGSLVVLGLTTL